MLAEIKPGELMLSASAHGFLAVAEWLRGRLAEAERGFASSLTGWRETGPPALIVWGCYELVLIQRAQGRLDAAVLTCKQALDSLVSPADRRRPRDRATWASPRSPISGMS